MQPGRGVRALAWLVLARAVWLASAASAAAATLAVEPATSRVTIHLGRAGLVRFLGHDHEIDAPLIDGRVEIDERQPSRSAVLLRFDAGRLAIVPGTEPASDVPTVEARMRGSEVLDVSRFPRIIFQSEVVTLERAGAAESYRLSVRGTLEIKGRPVAVELPVEVRRDGTGLVATGEVWLELRALGIEPPSVAGVVKVANRFRLVFEVRAHE